MYVVYKVEYGGPALSSIFKKVMSRRLGLLINSTEMTWLGIILKQFVSKFSNLLVHPLLLELFIGPQCLC